VRSCTGKKVCSWACAWTAHKVRDNFNWCVEFTDKRDRGSGILLYHRYVTHAHQGLFSMFNFLICIIKNKQILFILWLIFKKNRNCTFVPHIWYLFESSFSWIQIDREGRPTYTHIRDTMSHGPAHSIGLPNAKPVLVFFRACSNFVSLMCVYVGRPSLSICIHEKEDSNKYQICGTKVQFLFFLNINQRINKICLFLIMQMRKLNMEKSPWCACVTYRW
jgi:hypothetical protein